MSGRRIRYLVATWLLVAGMGLCPFFTGSYPAQAADSSVAVPQPQPTNPAFLQYRKALRAGTVSTLSDDGHSLGYRPDPVKLPQPQGQSLPSLQADALPSSFDLRSLGRISAVRTQGECSACWAFAALASLESCMKGYKPPQSLDFSEAHLIEYSGFDNATCWENGGGTDRMATAYLARWDGPVKESDYPNSYAAIGASGVSEIRHIQEVLFFPEREGKGNAKYLDNDRVKEAVMTHGAVSVCFKYQSSSYKSDTASYYLDKSNDTSCNHAGVVIGWDDHYAGVNFLEAPPGDGAFIVRNSWGKNWGDNGYFYLSYYDTSYQPQAVYLDAKPTSLYSRVYEWDPLGWTKSAGYENNDDTVWFANVFMASKSAPIIKAVSFYTPQLNCSYEVYLYKNITYGSPRSGKLIRTVKSTLPYPGYHTIEFDPVAITPGRYFSVVVKLVTPGTGYGAAIEAPIDGHSSTAKAWKGQSYLSHDGKLWSDLTSWTAKGVNWRRSNVCLKAFGGN